MQHADRADGALQQPHAARRHCGLPVPWMRTEPLHNAGAHDAQGRGAPVDGCTMPAVPPMPSTRCGRRGSTPPMGIKQHSSSSTAVTTTPRCARRARSRARSSAKPTAGRATRLVSSRNTRVGENGIAYKNVGSALRARSALLGHQALDQFHVRGEEAGQRRHGSDNEVRKRGPRCCTLRPARSARRRAPTCTAGALASERRRRRAPIRGQHLRVRRGVVVAPVHEQHGVQREQVPLHLDQDPVRALPRPRV